MRGQGFILVHNSRSSAHQSEEGNSSSFGMYVFMSQKVSKQKGENASAEVAFIFLHIYSDQDRSPWDGTTHIYLNLFISNLGDIF